MRFDSENRWESQAITFNCVFPLHGVFSCDFLICVHVRCVFLFFFCDVHVWTCVVSVVQWSSWVFMCGVCFSIIFLCVHVGRVFSVTFTCVHVWCVLFNDFLVCSCVACFSVVFRKQKKQTILSGGEVKFVTNTSPAHVTFFSPLPPKKNQMILQKGGSNLLQIHPQHLLHFLPPQGTKILLKLCYIFK